MDLEKLCRDFHANLKFIYWATLQEYENEKKNKDKLPKEKESTLNVLQDKMRYYQEAYKKVEILQERRHLTLVGEKGGYREAYQKMLKIIENKYHPGYSYTNLKIIDGKYFADGQYSSQYVRESIEETINEIDVLCKDYEIEINKEAKESQER